jgi:hypothetical protein
MTTQPNLFRLPQPKRIEVTRPRLVMLDRIELGKQPAANSGAILRRLIADGLIIAIIGLPAKYRLTPVGRMVRSRPRYPGGQREPSRISTQAG